VALAATLLPAGSLLRSTLVALFLLCCPGIALVSRFWPGRDRLEKVVMTIALSISVSVLVTELQTFAGWWQPRASLALLALITTLLTVPRPLARARVEERQTA
jgi:uncharacterized membrane protein